MEKKDVYKRQDLYYTKDQFRSLIKDSRTIGVNIVPEIDVPAHALAFTKTFQKDVYKRQSYVRDQKQRKCQYVQNRNLCALPKCNRDRKSVV